MRGPKDFSEVKENKICNINYISFVVGICFLIISYFFLIFYDSNATNILWTMNELIKMFHERCKCFIIRDFHRSLYEQQSDSNDLNVQDSNEILTYCSIILKYWTVWKRWVKIRWINRISKSLWTISTDQ